MADYLLVAIDVSGDHDFGYEKVFSKVTTEAMYLKA
jgi:hypothetical protein